MQDMGVSGVSAGLIGGMLYVYSKVMSRQHLAIK